MIIDRHDTNKQEVAGGEDAWLQHNLKGNEKLYKKNTKEI